MGDNKVLHEFEKQKLTWHDRFSTVSEKYTPHFGISTLTKKFYARHDALGEGAVSQPNVLMYVDVVGKKQTSGPREVYDKPATENQNYGWLWDKWEVYKNENDRELFCRGKVEDPLMKIQQLINGGLQMERYYKMLR